MCPCYSITHYPTLEKTDAQNIVACQNQSNKLEFSDNSKPFKMLFPKKKITGNDTSKTKQLTWNTGFNQRF